MATELIDRSILARFANPTILGTSFETEAHTMAAECDTVGLIRDVRDLEFATVWRTRVATKRAEVVAFFAPMKSLAYKLHRAICEREGGVLALLDHPDKRVVTAMQAFKAAEDARRREEEQRLAEQRRAQEQARLVAEAGAIESSEPALAAAILEEAVALQAPTVVLTDQVKAVVSFRKVWKWRYVGNDKARAMALLPREWLQPNETAIGARVRSSEGTVKIPGIEVYAEDIPLR